MSYDVGTKNKNDDTFLELLYASTLWSMFVLCKQKDIMAEKRLSFGWIANHAKVCLKAIVLIASPVDNLNNPLHALWLQSGIVNEFLPSDII